MDDQDPHPNEKGVPFCSEDPRCYDGKRCSLMGFPPSRSAICEPAVKELQRKLASLTLKRLGDHPIQQDFRWPAVVTRNGFAFLATGIFSASESGPDYWDWAGGDETVMPSDPDDLYFSIAALLPK